MKTKYIVFLFIASLLLNAFLGGMIMSGCLHGGPGPFQQMGRGMGPPPMEGMIFKRVQEQSEKLTAEGQKKVAVIVEKYQKLADKNGMKDKRHIFDDIQATMTAPKFDKVKIEKIHKELNANEMKFKESIGHMMTEIASALTDEDRILFFKELFPQRPDVDKDRHDPPEH